MSQRNAIKTHCPLGHAYTKENTRIDQTPTGQCRRCRACDRLRWGRKTKTKEINYENANRNTISVYNPKRTNNPS